MISSMPRARVHPWTRAQHSKEILTWVFIHCPKLLHCYKQNVHFSVVILIKKSCFLDMRSVLPCVSHKD